MSYSEIPHNTTENVHLCSSSTNNKTTSDIESPRSAIGCFLPSSMGNVDKLSYEFSKLHSTSEKSTRNLGHYHKVLKPRQKKYSTISSEISSSPKKANTSKINVFKSQSLPRNSSLNLDVDVDASLGNVVRLVVDDLASQITLLDLDVFKRIPTEELSSCEWTKKDKAIKCPNICAFTRRFNNISFWVVQEILNGITPKDRAEIVSHFIKVAKKLHELNNLHSLFAIVSAMRSASVYRMNKTWDNVSKKDKQNLDRLAALFSEENNWINLRQYLETLKLPCIPYLGLFLTDLVYIDLAFPNKTKGLEPEQRQTKMNNILRILSNYQSSDYSYLETNEAIQKYLQSIRYIEELQNIFEEDQYKKSLELEPKLPLASTPSSSKESIISYSLNLSPAKSSSMRVGSVGPTPTKFNVGHRKCQSLGTNIFSSKMSRISVGADFNRHLLDDSILDRKASSSSSAFRDATCDSSNTDSLDLRSSLGSMDFQGCVRRKTIMKEHKKPVASTWQYFWIQIWANQLIYFPPRYRKGSVRGDFKREPSKIRSLEGWQATSVENTSHGNTFQLINPELGHIYKFRTTSPEFTNLWLKALQKNNPKEYTNVVNSGNLMTFD